MLECNRFLEMDEEQIGIAGEMRGRLHGKDRRTVNMIIHSRDKKTPRRFGRNRFANDGEWDEDAQERMEAIARKHGFGDALHDLRVAVFLHRIKGLMLGMAACVSGEERVRLSGEVADALEEFCEEFGVNSGECAGRADETDSVEDKNLQARSPAYSAKNIAVSAVHTFWADLLRRVMDALA